MASDGNGSGVVTVYGNNGTALLEPSKQSKSATFSVKVGLAQMLRGGARFAFFQNGICIYTENCIDPSTSYVNNARAHASMEDRRRLYYVYVLPWT